MDKDEIFMETMTAFGDYMKEEINILKEISKSLQDINKTIKRHNKGLD